MMVPTSDKSKNNSNNNKRKTVHKMENGDNDNIEKMASNLNKNNYTLLIVTKN